MRAFIVLCLVATACAQYNYQVGGGSGVSSGSFNAGAASGSGSFDALNLGGGVSGGVGAGSSFGVGSSGSLGGSVSSGVVGGSSFGVSGSSGPALEATSSYGVSGSGSSFTASSSASPAFTGSSQGSFVGASNVAPAQAELEKEFYTFTANEEDFTEPAASNQINSVTKQGLRVIFIKGPENTGLENAALSLAKSAAEQQTAIYVLSKQADLSALANKLNTANENVSHKPEVHFVKYRTPEDAANAQRAIQAEYDALGGKSEHINGGVASSLNFASAAPAATAVQQGASFQAGTAGQQGGSFQVGTVGQQGGSFQVGTVGQQGGSFQAAAGGQQSGAFQAATSSTYLPASVIRRFRS
ncbi:fibroin heavy chain [Musca domestica]|uniref:Fibroin heavy chain n=1 Tax=Musca domestica TaxID=7370 RepID=A0A9J7D9M4_MUSDO|nr:fibroin heavy chain [Musca domestica]